MHVTTAPASMTALRSQLKMIYSVVFPVRYSDHFFKDVVARAESGLVKLGDIQ